LYKLTIS